jgi:hypothetical protein
LPQSKVPFLKEVQTFPNGPLLFEHCSKFGLEGVVSKRLASRYSSGPSRNWVKTKCPDRKRINAERWRIFEGQPKPPVPTERESDLERKRAELARVRATLARAGLRAGLFAAMKAQERLLSEVIEDLKRTPGGEI